MKKITFFFLAIFLTAGIASAQMIEDFEHIPLNVMLGDDDNSSMSVVPTPEGTDNSSTHVVKFERSMNGVTWGGFFSTLPEALDLTVNKYVHVRVWKPRITPLRFKVEGGPSANLEIFSMNEQTKINEWEDIVFDFSEVTGEWKVIAFMPDFEEPMTLTEDIVIYFDYIMVNNDPTPDSEAVYVIEDFDHIPLNLMLGEDTDNSSMTVVANPDPNELNPSGNVVRYYRSMNGVVWGGFWSALPVPVDLTTNKYMYVKVWKPRLTPMEFKVEGGPTPNHQIPSMYPQTKIEEWEEIVFDFSELTGTWNVISFMPDFEDPLTLTEDIVIYFDDIRLGGDPLSVNPKINLSNLQVFPNPAKDFVNIRHDKAIREVKIYDLTGKVVIKENYNNNQIKIDLNNLKEGMYIIQVTAENQVFSLKLIH